MEDKDQNIKTEEKEFEQRELDDEQIIDPGNEHNHLEKPAEKVKQAGEPD